MRLFISILLFVLLAPHARAQTLQSSQFKIENSSYSVDTESAIDSSSYSISSETDAQAGQSFEKNGYVARSDISAFRFSLDSSNVDFDSSAPEITVQKRVHFSSSSPQDASSSIFLQQITPFSSFGGISIPDNLFSYKIQNSSAIFQLKIPRDLPEGSYATSLNLTATAGY